MLASGALEQFVQHHHGEDKDSVPGNLVTPKTAQTLHEEAQECRQAAWPCGRPFLGAISYQSARIASLCKVEKTRLVGVRAGGAVNTV